MGLTRAAFKPSLVRAASLILIALLSIPLLPAPAHAVGPKIIHVNKNHPNASNNNPGTKDKPLATVNEAAHRAQELRVGGREIQVLIHPGVYRETVNFHWSRVDNAGPVLFKGLGKNGATISGSEIYTGWTEAPGSNIWVHDWPHRWGETDPPDGWPTDIPAAIRRREMVFVNNHYLKQVLSEGEMAQNEGTFYVSENEKKIYIHPRGTTNIGEATVEVGTRPLLFAANGQRHVTMRKLTFEHAVTPMPDAGVYFAGAFDIKVVDSNFRWNNWSGLYISSSHDVTLDRVVANHNGVTGFGAGGSYNLLFDHTRTSYNNWRGSRGWDPNNHGSAIRDHFIDFSTGQKFVHIRDATFLRHKSVGNLTGGLWFDTDNKRIVLDHVVLKDNMTHGVFIEATQGPFLLKDSLVCNNESGVLLQHSTDGTLKGNVIRGNILGAVFVAGIAEARRVTDSETGKQLNLHAERWTILENAIRAPEGSFNMRTYLPDEQWKLFVDTLTSNNNKWNHAEGTDQTFRIPGNNITFKEWQDYSGQDKLSNASTAEIECKHTEAPGGASAAPSGGGQDGPGTGDSPPIPILVASLLVLLLLSLFRVVLNRTSQGLTLSS